LPLNVGTNLIQLKTPPLFCHDVRRNLVRNRSFIEIHV